MIRLILILLIGYFIYAIYKKTQNPKPEHKVKNLGKAKVVPETTCPNPKTFVDYIEGKIKGKQKEEIRRHIDNCKDCMDALQAVFDMPTKKERVPKEAIDRAKRVPKMHLGNKGAV